MGTHMYLGAVQPQVMPVGQPLVPSGWMVCAGRFTPAGAGEILSLLFSSLSGQTQRAVPEDTVNAGWKGLQEVSSATSCSQQGQLSV